MPLRTSSQASRQTPWTAQVSPKTDSTRPEADDKAHHKGSGKFCNPWPSWKPMDPEALKQHVKERKWSSTWSHPSTSKINLPVLTPTFSEARFDTGSSDIRATWLGHASYLVEFPSGLRVIFDPVLTDRCSPMSWLGPRRFTRAPCQIKDIPIIDAVVISHNHYDHLSHPTVTEIKKLHPNAHFFVPLGNKSWFKSSGIHNVTELDWWEEADITISQDGSDIVSRFSCVPAQHTSGRGLFGTDATLWASWGVRSWSGTTTASDTATTDEPKSSASVFFSGDTGYRTVPPVKSHSSKSEKVDDWEDEELADLPVCTAFEQIGQLRGPFDLGLIPIGAYEPRGLMSNIHASPRDAVAIQKDTRCKRALAMHWGTWVLGDEDVREPPQKLKEALVSVGLPEEGVFDVVNPGETVVISRVES